MAMTESFELALQGRVDAMVDACTRCGKCVEVCPAIEPAGLSAEQRQNPVEVITGVINLLGGGAGSDSASKWASGCFLSGEGIEACDYGVNPRFLLGMARVAMRRLRTRRRRNDAPGSRVFAPVARDVDALSAASTRRRAIGAPRPSRLLYGLQRTQDAAHRAFGARRHGRARHQL
jgi:heterodisulfide reductase subunit D